MQRKYQNPVEGSLEHAGVVYAAPETDQQWIMTLMLGDLLYMTEVMEVWVWQGLAVITVNEVEEILAGA